MKDFYLSENYINDNVALKLINDFKIEYPNNDGYIYYAFPSIKEMDEKVITPNLFIMLKGYGVFSVVCSDIASDRGNVELYEDIKHTIDSFVFSKLIKNKKLSNGSRNLNFNYEVISYYPNLDNYDKDAKKFNNFNQIKEWLEELKNSFPCDFDDKIMKEVFSSIDASSAIIRPKSREINTERFTKSNVLATLESQIASFDDEQRLAALSLLEGPQRIRGLAGTGKTIILCLKAAKLHYEYPDKKILYTFYTKSLYDYIRQLITRFYTKFSDGYIPDFDNSVLIRHSWGGKTLSGVYSDVCSMNNVVPLKLSDIKGDNIDNSFDFVCKDLLEKTNANLIRAYDYVLIDEAQDFSPSFYQLCKQIVKDDHIIWCYDELQNIFDVKLQRPNETFANKRYKISGIDLKKLNKKVPNISNDIVLSKSYRNLKEILVTAHALGFGIYNDKLIQSLENNEHWKDLGYQVVSGNCTKEDNMIIERIAENSPLRMPAEYESDDIIVVESFEKAYDECEWVCQQIDEAINLEGLKADDIAIVSIDDKNSHIYEQLITNNLYSRKIKLYSIIERFYQKGFSKEGAVTFSSVYKAKGNEAAMVFVVGCDAFENAKDSRAMRNKIFTAFTRAKVWLRISGVNIKDGSLVNEIECLKNNNYVLKFKNTPLTILQRDWDENSRRLEIKNDMVSEFIKLAEKNNIELDELIEALKDGKK